MRTLLTRAGALARRRPHVGARTRIGHEGLRAALSQEIDANGSPVTIDKATWFVCFVPGLQKQWWHRFAHESHRHVFAIRKVRDDTWLLVEPWWTRLMVNVLTFDEAVKFLRWGAAGHILEVSESIPGHGSQARGWSNCAVLASFLLGRSYWTWTPHGLYRRLKADPDVREVELTQFLKEHITALAKRNADALPEVAPVHDPDSLQDALVELGVGILTAATSTSAVSLYRATVSESDRFKEAAQAFWTFGPYQAVDRIRDLLEGARLRGELSLADAQTAARQFLAMLRGDLYLHVVFGMRSAPGPREIRAHATSVAQVFLRGARPAAERLACTD